MKPGDLVDLDAFGGARITRRVVAVTNTVVEVCTENEYADAERGARRPVTIGFPIGDVLGLAQPSGA